MATKLAPARGAASGALRLGGLGRQRRPWQAALGVMLALVSASVTVSLFQAQQHDVSVVVAARDLPAGSVVGPGDLASGAVSASGGITALAATDLPRLIGRRLDQSAVAGQVLVRQMLASGPVVPPGEQLVGALLRGDQAPQATLQAGATVEVVLVPSAGQLPAAVAPPVTVLAPIATIFALGAPPPDGQFAASVTLEVPAAAAASVTAAAAADQIGLSVVPGGGS